MLRAHSKARPQSPVVEGAVVHIDRAAIRLSVRRWLAILERTTNRDRIAVIGECDRESTPIPGTPYVAAAVCGPQQCLLRPVAVIQPDKNVCAPAIGQRAGQEIVVR